MTIIPQPGDFAVVRMDGTPGRLIRIGQWLNGDGFADYEHAFVLIDGGMVIEAEPHGARIVPLADYNGWPKLWSSGHVELSAEQRDRIVNAARRYVGTPYSFLDYLAIAAHRLRLPIPWLRTYVANSRHMICSQLVSQCYWDAGVYLFPEERWPGYVTPADLANLIKDTR